MAAEKGSLRPVHILSLVLLLLCILNLTFYFVSMQRQKKMKSNGALYDVVTSALGLTDLCVATEARYTRHPAVSDPMAPFMDHPGAVEHFPTGSFWVPSPSVPDEEHL